MNSFYKLALSAAFFMCGPLVAQDISGRVVVYGRVEDAASRTPIEGARLIAADSSITVYTGAGGEFAIPLPADGPFAVYAQQPGYLSQRFDLDPLQLSRMTVLLLEPAPFELEGLTVVAEAALARLVRNIEGRARASDGAVASLDRRLLDRYGRGASVFDVVRNRAPRITECLQDPGELCTWSRWVSFRSAYPEVLVNVCVDERRSLSPVNELSNLWTESVAKVEIFGRTSVRVYTLAWMAQQARIGHTSVLPEWMGC